MQHIRCRRKKLFDVIGIVQVTQQQNIATNWLLSSLTSVDARAAKSSVLVLVPNKRSKGTGWALAPEGIITNHHVIAGVVDPADLRIVGNQGQMIAVTDCKTDPILDLAYLVPEQPIGDPVPIDTSDLVPGRRVHTWGFPLSYSGPSPLLSVGYVAGFRDEWHTGENRPIKRLVVNGAFNPGNSGGPLFTETQLGVVGVVVSKHVPFTNFQISALEALQNMRSGFMYTATDGSGNTQQFTEAQLVADLIGHLRTLTQVMIGEAIAAEELVSFLDTNGIRYETV